MKNNLENFTLLTLTILAFFFMAEPAQAYIDPGSGSALMSLVVGLFVASGVLIKTFWYKIKSFLGLSKTQTSSTENGLHQTEQKNSEEQVDK